MNRFSVSFISAPAFLAGMSLLASPAFAQTKAGQVRPSTAPRIQTANVMVNDKGFSPARISLKAGMPARLTFTRTSKNTCATSVVIPEYKVKKELPLGKPVVVTFTPKKAGSYSFACGMNMLRGSVIVQ